MMGWKKAEMRASRATYRHGFAQAKGRGGVKPAALVVRPRPSDRRQGILRLGPHALPCALGRGSTTPFKREGDGKTPIARLPVLFGFFRPGCAHDLAPLRGKLPMRRAGKRLGWCDASGDRNYNRPVRLPYPASHEEMRRADRLYDACLVLDWNFSVRRRGRGSAIFLHLARPGFAPTEGCVAVCRRTMRRILGHLARGSIVIVKG